jgi:S-adenosylmethionine synthetase
MFGYACDETPTLMPFPIYTAHRLTEGLAKARRDGTLPYLRPDGKSQVSVWYENGVPKKVTAVVLSAQHDEDVATHKLVQDLKEKVIRQIIPAEMLADDTAFHINPTGRFVTGGPQGDTGLTGRKVIVDTYGGMGRHGGGAFSGKDPTKVDRSACYIAKNVVASGLARRAEVQLAYAIGVAEPVSVMVDTFETGSVDEVKLAALIREIFPLTPAGIMEYLDLRRPIYKKTAAYGHFGRELPEFTWEKVHQADNLRARVTGIR